MFAQCSIDWCDDSVIIMVIEIITLNNDLHPHNYDLNSRCLIISTDIVNLMWPQLAVKKVAYINVVLAQIEPSIEFITVISSDKKACL